MPKQYTPWTIPREQWSELPEELEACHVRNEEDFSIVEDDALQQRIRPFDQGPPSADFLAMIVD